MVSRCRSLKDEGFTLVEVIIVIIIIGFLAGIAVISLSSANRTGQVAACKSDYQAVYAALTSYKNDRVDALTNRTLYPSVPVGTGPDSLVSLGYLSGLPLNGTYRIFLKSGTLDVGVETKTESGWNPVTGSTYTVNDCSLIDYAGQS